MAEDTIDATRSTLRAENHGTPEPPSDAKPLAISLVPLAISVWISSMVWGAALRARPAVASLQADFEARFGRAPTSEDWYTYDDARAVFCGHELDATDTVVGQTIDAEILYGPTLFVSLTAALVSSLVAFIPRATLHRRRRWLTWAIVASIVAIVLIPLLFSGVITAYSNATE